MPALQERLVRLPSTAEAIFREMPHGERWAERLTEALRLEYTKRSVGMEPVIKWAKPPRLVKAQREPKVAELKPPRARRRDAQPWRPKAVMVRPSKASVTVKMVPRLTECSECGKPFGPDRQRHWFNENVDQDCHERQYGSSAVAR